MTCLRFDASRYWVRLAAVRRTESRRVETPDQEIQGSCFTTACVPRRLGGGGDIDDGAINRDAPESGSVGAAQEDVCPAWGFPRIYAR